MDVVITYDIADTDGPGGVRLRRVHEICSAYGQWVQFSVFEFRLAPERFQRLVDRLADVIEPDVDSVTIYRFDGSLEDHRTCLGRRAGRRPGEPWIL